MIPICRAFKNADIFINIVMIGLIVICHACGNSPTKDEDREQNVEQPDLTIWCSSPLGSFLWGVLKAKARLTNTRSIPCISMHITLTNRK